MDYTKIPSPEVVERTMSALNESNFASQLVQTKAEAFETIKQLIPSGVSVMNGSSTTLEEIGFIEYLKRGEHGWNNFHETIVNEQDPAKQAQLRKNALLSDYYLGSVHAVTEKGELVIASNTGSQLPHLAYSSTNVILVVSTNKITQNLDAAMQRIREHIIPLEDARMKSVYGVGTNWAKTLILSNETPFNGRTITIVFVNEQLGF